jgi:uncharacterized protein YutE (UPF0331/DUF86 family)
MERSRANRYKQKIAYILNCIDEIDNAMPKPEGIVLKGIYYDLSSAIDAAMDMIAMLCKDLGIMPRGDYENIESLEAKSILNADLAERLANCNGLRNVLVHQYNGIDENLVLESTQPVERDLKEFVKVVEEHITKH